MAWDGVGAVSGQGEAEVYSTSQVVEVQEPRSWGQEPAAGASVAMGRDAVEKQHSQSGGQSWAGPIANAQLYPGWNLLQEAKGTPTLHKPRQKSGQQRLACGLSQSTGALARPGGRMEVGICACAEG